MILDAINLRKNAKEKKVTREDMEKMLEGKSDRYKEMVIEKFNRAQSYIEKCGENIRSRQVFALLMVMEDEKMNL